MSDGYVAFEKWAGMLRVVLTAPPRVSVCILLTHLSLFCAQTRASVSAGVCLDIQLNLYHAFFYFRYFVLCDVEAD